ncbi:MAG: WD40 repeat domain-containing protein [Leptolyngbyaceae cyanobacterium MO_188.B28]|nr:WD40 repeat domain-containing protein [Leptolyngbyaceae cyanobacterium MO_188.B28]
MTEPSSNRSIRIEDRAVGSAIVSGDGNTIYVIQQATEQRREEATSDTATNIGPNPYKGLAAFKESDADCYFGREAQIERLWQRFHDLVEQSGRNNAAPRILLILGPSGCGKSSLARAGFIPELARRPLPGKDHMRVAVMMPGSRPLEALAGVLAKVATDDPLPVEKAGEFEEALKKTSDAGECEGLRRIANLIPGIRDTSLVILVDQFEEVYSLCKDTQQRNLFINNLLHAASDSTGDVSMVITLRSDFWGETQQHEQLNQVIGSDQSVNVPAMTVAELRRAIAEPAKQAGYSLDEATIDLLVKDTEGREGALPLLQFALTRIWDGLSEGKTPTAMYREIGGVGGALAGKAQEMYDKLTDSEKEIARRIFVGLVQLGEGARDTRRRVPVDSLIASRDQPERVQQVIRQLSSSGARLVALSSSDGHEIAEVTHEALFEHWRQLNDWLDSSRDDIRFQRRLESAADYWNQQGRPKGLLWRSPDLDLLQTFERKWRSDMTPLSVEFFEAADQAEKQEEQRKAQEEQRKRLFFWVIVASLLFTTTLSVFSVYKVHQGARRQMRIYAATAENLADTDKPTSLVNALAAIGVGRSIFVKLPSLSRNGLVPTAVLERPNRTVKFRYIAGHTSDVTSVAFSPDGQRVVSGSEDNTVRLWDLQGNAIGEPFQGHTSDVTSVTFSPDGQTVVSGGADGTVRLSDLQGNAIGESFQANTLRVNSVAFSPDGQIVVSGGLEGVQLWDLQGNAIGEPFQGHFLAVNSVAFSPDGQIVVSGSYDKTVRLWDLQGNAISEPFQGHGLRGNWVPSFGGTSVAFSPDGQAVVSGGADGTVRLWDLQGNAIGEPFQGHTADVLSVAFSSDGQTVVSGGADGTVRLWPTWFSGGWVPFTCNRIRGYFLSLNRSDDVTREARRTCEKYGWK